LLPTHIPPWLPTPPLVLVPTWGFRWRFSSMRQAARSTCGTRSMPARRRSTTRRCPDIMCRRPSALINAPADITNAFLNGHDVLPVSAVLDGIPITLDFPLDGILVGPTPATLTLDGIVTLPNRRHADQWPDSRAVLRVPTARARNHAIVVEGHGAEGCRVPRVRHLPKTTSRDHFRLELWRIGIGSVSTATVPGQPLLNTVTGTGPPVRGLVPARAGYAPELATGFTS
jgi:hypothetical protein